VIENLNEYQDIRPMKTTRSPRPERNKSNSVVNRKKAQKNNEHMGIDQKKIWKQHAKRRPTTSLSLSDCCVTATHF